MILINQAIYGEKSGHNLLNSSFENVNIPKRLSGFTDLVDRPPTRILSQPLVRGIFEDDYFLLIKSFPDLSPGVRSGRVFSHALIIEKEQYLKILDITELLKYHLPDINKNAQLNSISHENIISTNKPSSNGIIAAAINATANHLEYENTILWASDKGYFEWISQLWPNIPDKVKMNIRIGGAFDPKFVNHEKLNLLYIPSSLKFNWSKQEYKIVDELTQENLNSQTANLLAGNQSKSVGLRNMIDSYRPSINRIEDYQLFENYLQDHEEIGSKTNFRQLLILSDLVSRKNTNPKSGTKGKLRLLNEIVNQIKKASPIEIKALSYQSWKGFENAVPQVSKALRLWLESNLFTMVEYEKKANIVYEALSSNEDINWWKKVVKDQLCISLKNWQDLYSNVLYKWFQTNNDIIQHIEHFLPNESEISLSKNLPNLARNTSELILELAIRKNWLLLHGLVAVKIYSPKEAITKQLSIDKEQLHYKVFKKISERVTPEVFIETTILLEDERLYKIAAQLIVKKPKLLNKINVSSPSWQKLWLNTYEEGAELWHGVSSPNDVLYELLDQIINEKFINLKLLSCIEKSDYNDLSDYPKRAEIWNFLSKNNIQNFISRTSKTLLDRCLSGLIEINEIEKPIFNHIKTDEFLSVFLNKNKQNIDLVIKIFESFSGLKDQFLADYILFYSSDISEYQASKLGTLVKQNKYSKTARIIFAKSKNSKTYTNAYNICSELVELNFFERLFNNSPRTSYNINSPTKFNKSDMESSIPIIVILTAIKEEYQAVKKHLINISDADIEATTYEAGEFQFQGQKIANVIIRECGAKNTTSSQETERAISNFNPDLIFFVGIAGSRKPNDFRIGDVIFPDKVYYYEGGKATKKGFKSRPDAVSPTYELIEKAKKERSKEDWKKFIKGTYDRSPNADIGIIASGEQLIDHHNSDVGVILEDSYNDSSVVEMEGYGFLKAIDRQGGSKKNILCGVVRGISDIIDKDELNQSSINNDRRPANAKVFASDSASAFTFWLIFKILQKQ